MCIYFRRLPPPILSVPLVLLPNLLPVVIDGLLLPDPWPMGSATLCPIRLKYITPTRSPEVQDAGTGVRP